MQGTVWVLAFALAPVVTGAVAVAAWRHRHGNPPARALAVVLLGISGWCLAVGVVLAPSAPAVRAAGFPLIFLSVGATAAGFLALSRLLAEPTWRPRRHLVLLASVEPVLLAVTSVLPATTDLVFGRTDLTAPAGAVQMVGGPLFLLHSLYSYAFIAWALVRLVRLGRRGQPVVRRQARVLLVSALPPTLGNLVFTLGMRGEGVVDLTPLFFIVTGLVAGWAILRTGLLELVPVARDQVVETMTDGVLVTDEVGRVIDLNPAARRMLAALRPGAGPAVLGRPLAELAGADLLRTVLPDGPAADGTYETGRAVVEAAPGCWLDVQSVPVASAGRRIGRVTVVRDVTEAQLREADLRRLAQQLAEQVATVDRLRAAVAEEAVRDPLTGLHNRRHLDRTLLHALARSVDDGLPVAVVLVDVDRFKSVNDRFGHATGDAVLCAVAAELRAGTRSGDTVARAGGEEFVLVLPGADEAEALARAETVRARVGALVHVVPGGVLTVTLSAGVAVARSGGDGAAELLSRADRALYRAKSGGRDRVVAAGVAGADVSDVLSTA
ncbi:GGDEF domain-containing protein [Klenkia soli]|uniref:GGDEF domain-containing protein n=1 Tax=Klenkia soli TaxID=1052260 RepID=UPI0013F4C9F6|nr:diguanylate cyclase [Klenkia soli]